MSQTTTLTPQSGPPNRPLRLLLVGGVVSAGLCAGLFLFLAQNGMLGKGGTSPRLISPGMDAPDFTLPTQDQRTMHLADYRGRAVFLAFVPSWTDTKTVAEVRALAKKTDEFDAAGAKVMVVGTGPAATAPADAIALHDREKLPYPLLLDHGDALAKTYGVPTGGGYRTTFVVTPLGKVKYRVSDAAVEADRHGQQLIDISKCCIDDVVASRAHGIGKAVGDYSLPRPDKSGAMERVFGDGTVTATAVLFLSVKCPCSNSYNDRVRALAEEYSKKGVRVVGVYANQDETAAAIAEHAREQRFSFPIYKDERALCADHFGASVTPEVFVLDGAHALRYAGRLDSSRNPDEAKEHDLRQALDVLLTGSGTIPLETRAFGCGIVRTNPQ